MGEEEETKIAMARKIMVTQFMANLQILVVPAFVLGYTKAIDEAFTLLNAEQRFSLRENDNYSPQTTDLVICLAEWFK